MAAPAVVDFVDYPASVFEALDKAGAGPVLAKEKKVLIKPNLVTNKPFPVTTSPKCCGAVIDYVRSWSAASIIIAEGTGDPSHTTMEVFAQLGYARLASAKNTGLIDLNSAPLIRLENNACPRFPVFYMPQIAMDHFIISVPVLKAHLFSAITGTLKNMVGFAPPSHYAGNGGVWNKAAFHIDVHQSITDINCYRHADLTLFDASVGMPDYHLGGALCNPPVKKLIAGFDPVETDRTAAAMLGLDWRTIPHLCNPVPAIHNT
jgi:uncharacterized protein (DUF362 family)